MTSSAKTFEVVKTVPGSRARTGKLTTRHGVVNTPIFCPVGTQGSVKILLWQDLEKMGTEMILGNTYHLYLRPGLDVIRAAGGLHKFINWNGAILTDSGGYQVFSMESLRKISEEGVKFKSHVDGSAHFFTPERAIEIQAELGSDIMMCFDEVAPYPCTEEHALKHIIMSDPTL